MDETEVFSAVGEEGFARLIAAFYRQVPSDDILDQCILSTIWLEPNSVCATT